MKKIILFSVLLAMTLFSPKNVEAVGFDLSVSPGIFQIELTPPAVAKAEKTILLENTGDDALELQIIYKPFSASSAENGEVVFEENFRGPDPEILKKVQLLDGGKPVDSVTLSPKQKKQIDLVITIPKDEPPYDYYFTILFLAQEPTDATLNSSTTISQGGIGVNVLLSIGPKNRTTGVIEEFSAPFFFSSGPVPFNVRVKNTSRHFIYPKGHIMIKNMFGQIIGKVELLPVNILSNSTRALPSGEQFIYAANENIKEDKEIERIQKLTTAENKPIAVWPESFLLGPYTATLTMALSEDGPIYTRDIHFIGFPLQLLIGVGIILLVILLIRSRLKARS